MWDFLLKEKGCGAPKQGTRNEDYACQDHGSAISEGIARFMPEEYAKMLAELDTRWGGEGQ
jgi:hypothetical protein